MLTTAWTPAGHESIWNMCRHACVCVCTCLWNYDLNCLAVISYKNLTICQMPKRNVKYKVKLCTRQ